MCVHFYLDLPPMLCTFVYIMEDNSKSLKIGVRPETRAKFDAIARDRRWTLAETADALADEFMKSHNISAPSEPDPVLDPNPDGANDNGKGT